MKKYFVLSFTLAVLAIQPVFAQTFDDECDPSVEECAQEAVEVSDDTPRRDIYPFKPLLTTDIQSRVERLTENKEFLWDMREMNRRGLTSKNTNKQPWGGSFWPLFQGQIANTYSDKGETIFESIFTPGRSVSWKNNLRKFEKRAQKELPKVYSFSEKELADMAPSEKYDILMGDTSFDLTKRIWAFQERWGSGKKWNFLSSIDLPAGYRIPEGNSFMALWEGICHGWAVAAGHTARPSHTVWVTLPNGKKMPFFPNDIKALISLMWANSNVQDNVISEGLRCNDKSPKKDKYGRYIDTKLDRNDTELLPRCADVHPAVYHASIVNILGIEGRSFVADVHAKASVANQPVSGYEYVYFNPDSGKDGGYEQSLISVANYKDDPFKASRNPETKFIVGVNMKLKYVDWEMPKVRETNFPSDDKISDIEFNYDLELNADHKIIGGQWRVRKNGKPGLFKGSTDQPDFFWVVPRDYKKYFEPVAGLPTWDFSKSTLPPKEFAPVAKSAHAFVYNVTREFGFAEKCDVLPLKDTNGKAMKVPCEFKYPRPQPLINVVNTLLEQSSR